MERAMSDGSKLAIGLALALLLWIPGKAIGGGYAIPHQTAKAVGLSNAVTAGVTDPSAVYYNPAALTAIEGNQLLGGITYLNIINSVENGGVKSRNRRDDNSIPTFFANFHIPDSDFTLGFGTHSPFGLATTYDKDAFTRYAINEAKLKIFYLTWAAAWSPSDLFSVGAGVSFVRGKVALSRAIFLDTPLIPGVQPDGRARLTDSDNAFAYNLGLLLKHPGYPLKFGFTFRSRTYLDLDGGNVDFVDFDGTFFNTKINRGSLVLPAVISAGINWQITPRWSLEFVYDWTKWDDLETLKLIFDTPLPALGGAPAAAIGGLSVSSNWKNTSTLRLGSLFHLNETWDLLGGIGLDETPIPSNTLGPLIPGADILTLNGGASYSWKKLKFTAAYMAVFYEDRRVQNAILEAEATALVQPFTPGRDKYETFNHFLSVNVNYQF